MSARQDLARVLAERRHLRADFGAWCRYALAPIGQKPASHHDLLIRELQAIEDGENDRLMIMMPPGSAKSTYASKLFPAHYLARHPGSLVIGASHGQGLADTFSGDVQRFVNEHGKVLGYGLENEAKDFWKTTNGGAYRAVGTGGSITGRRASLVIWDDPIKGHEEADSPIIREKAWNWYRSDMTSRLLPGASIVLISTRWHQDDPCGRLLNEMADGGDKWRVISLPAIAETNDALGRKPGEVLWPEWEDSAAIARKRRISGERIFASLYQQQPRPAEGSILKSTWWRPWTDPAPLRPDMTILSLDLAYTAKEQNDYSACTVWDIVTGQEPVDFNGTYVQPAPAGPEDFRSKALLRFAWAERLEFPELVEGLLKTVKSYKRPSIPMRVLIEAKGPGLSVIQELRRRMPSLHVFSVVPKGDKVARAHSVTAMMEGGVVYGMAERDGAFKPAVQGVIDECAAFPLGSHDDRADSVTQLLRHVRDLGFELFAEDAPPTPSFRPAVALY